MVCPDGEKDPLVLAYIGMLLGAEKASRGDTISSGQYGFSGNNDPFSRVRSSFVPEDVPDAASEKDLVALSLCFGIGVTGWGEVDLLGGNEFFKQKKFKEAIDCYSRSIALSPTAVAYANRAMAYIKLRRQAYIFCDMFLSSPICVTRFQEAEDDCTEALNLDDRYIKAYSRRATARKELGKIKESMEDAEFALRLEPNNQEIKKQYADAKSLYEKGILQKASGALRSSVQGAQKLGKSETKVNGGRIHSISHDTQTSGPSEVHHHNKGNERQIPAKESFLMEETFNRDTKARSRTQGQEGDGSKQVSSSSNSLEQRNHSTRKLEMKTSIQQLASRAASRAMAEAAKNITPPTTAYQFEASWRGFSGDLALQTRLLKAISPHELPKIFKNALSSTLLIEIIKCVASFFTEEMDLAISYMENLIKVPRFDMIIMCLPSADKDDLHKIWDEVFCSEATPMEYAEILDNLRSKFGVGQ
ncbi:Tetratricopeptide-like helical domain superfamily [Sesbania bispinosa]|nr:Tetratricopeptide-like helical domain superfamily [Sesbania bispinosa]